MATGLAGLTGPKAGVCFKGTILFPDLTEVIKIIRMGGLQKEAPQKIKQNNLNIYLHRRNITF